VKTYLVLTASLLFSLCAAAAPMGLNNPFFVMDTCLWEHPGNAEEQAALLGELGYAGYGASNRTPLPEMAAALEKHDLRLFTYYTHLKIDETAYALQENLDDFLPVFAEHHTTIWVTITSDVWGPSESAGDFQAIAALEALLNRIQSYNLTIALYPHANTWLETIDDAMRIAQVMDRPEVSATFNLCHWLHATQGQSMQALVQRAAPWLSLVTINGADMGDSWDQLIQPLGKGAYDVYAFLKALKDAGYAGPIGLQGYAVKGDPARNLRTSMTTWETYEKRFTDEWIRPLEDKGFNAFHDPVGDWLKTARVYLDPDNREKLVWEGEGLEAVNGPEGRTKHLVTRHEHGDVEAHVEFMVPHGSNSGVYFQGRYEIQVLDSWGVKEPAHSDCGGIYQRYHESPDFEGEERGYEGRPPRVNAAEHPGDWQSYDVIFRAPEFNTAGEKTADAEFVRIYHNGVMVHARRTVSGPTRSAMFMDEQSLGPVMFQGDHGPVAYRNIMLRPLPPAAKQTPAVAEAAWQALGRYTLSESRKPLIAIEMAIQQAPRQAYPEFEQKLIGLLADETAAHACREFCCRMLSRVGGAASVPVLAELLHDEKLSHMARNALLRIPGEEAEEALLRGLAETGGLVRIGIINTLGQRGSPAALDALAFFLDGADEETTAAAADAIAAIGGAEAMALLRKAPDADNAEVLIRARLECARSLDRGAARAVYQDVLDSNAPPLLRRNALSGLVRLDGEEALTALTDCLESGADAAMKNIAIRQVPELEAPDATARMTALLPELEPEWRAKLLDALAARGDPGALAGVAACLADENGEVRMAALKATGSLGNAAMIEPLLKFSTSATGRMKEMARQALADLPDAEAATVLLEKLRTAGDAMAEEIILVLQERQAAESADELIRIAREKGEKLQITALKALAELADSEKIDQLISVWEETEEKARTAAERALSAAAQRAPDPEKALEKITALWDESADELRRSSLIGILGSVPGRASLEVLRGSLNLSDNLREASVRAMAGWPDDAPLEDLFEIAATAEDDRLATVAFRGIVRIIGLPSDRPPAETLQLYKHAMALAEDASDRKRVLGGLGAMGHAGAMMMALEYLEDPDVKAEAAAAVLSNAEKAAAENPAQTRAALKQLLESDPDIDTRNRAKTIRNKLDAEATQEQ
jgi:sugar phosphate isomerase/epimerase/HEAT repeat protein